MRVCNRKGCGKDLVTKSGAPEFKRHFCSRECKNADNKEKKATKRARIHGRKCSLCGRQPIQNRELEFSVSRDEEPVEAAVLNAEEYISAGGRLRSERPNRESRIRDVRAVSRDESAYGKTSP